MTMTYNGWKNRATWNVALWVNNDEHLYNASRGYVFYAQNMKHRITWSGFLAYAGLSGERTKDGYKYDGKALDTAALVEMLKENGQ